ncbi:hypothetical protein A8C56_15000 [Niabella ginsenosidivorans]|uniref:DUF4143 domain-containing protein n=1 Tax=Niabella ginsenosidivorans TaxID=1176587 RepID=A0A1A9I359_9BACT|nr:DUF4143 domain-containing protein [Niabella ginsenosidivorans]ANH82107.1 hypothetical protein A8C56_15000 [Niabella ginsenosidivorans]
MLVANTGTLLNNEQYARSLGISGPTVKRYLDFLEGAFLIRRLQPWLANVQKRIVRSAKIYVRDTGIVHAVCGIASPAELPGNVIIGGSRESYVVEEVIRHLPKKLRAFYYRTQHGAEADLVLVKGIRPVACIEIEYSKAPVPASGFYQCIKDLKTKHNYLIYAGKEGYQNREGVQFTSLEEMLQVYYLFLINTCYRVKLKFNFEFTR